MGWGGEGWWCGVGGCGLSFRGGVRQVFGVVI